MWSLNPFEQDRYRYCYDPMERMMMRAFDDRFRDMDRSLRSLSPYWLDPRGEEFNLGSAIGSIVNDKEKFAVDIDVSQFRPEELSVNVKDKELVVEGHQEERSDENGTIERHFIRKYAIPADTNAESIKSQLTNHGVLTIFAPKIAIEARSGRAIPIEPAPSTSGQKIEAKKQ